ncbi:helix-turn-helix domain-containing protein [Candidatus Solirubrobacter pratensis]|uniref:hypothetical protein n=1 Tax=Candidatus Solirubrobacter pratensis TaxID=1298857 RepID=UPI0012DE2E2E|nr:hypothetical protein [Candidatus Solirubrobacter pratensis]
MQFHVSPSTVSKYLTERGVSLRWGGKRTTPEQDRIEEIRRLYWVEYKTTHEIADIIGISQRTVHSRMRKYDVPTRRACWRPPHMRPRKGESREAVRRRQIVWGE